MTGQISYRVGRHQAQNVYRHGPGDPPDGSYIGVFFNPETAALVCEALNERDRLGRQQQAVIELANLAEVQHRKVHPHDIYKAVITDPGDAT